MKVLLMLLVVFSTFTCNLEVKHQPIVCPKLSELEEISIGDREEFLKALESLVPQTYINGEYAEMYSEWEIITATPLYNTLGKEDEVYYDMAKNFCGEEVAKRSWLVRLYFPKWEGKSASSLEGQIFAAKSKEKGWFVWFRYH